MKRNWSIPELERFWSVRDEERRIDEDKRSDRRLALAILTRFLEIEGRFPRYHREVPAQAIRHVAGQLGVGAQLFSKYQLDGRRAKADRQLIRARLGWREATIEDGERLRAWLRTEVLQDEISFDAVKERASEWLREQRIEPFTPAQMERYISAAIRAHERHLYTSIANSLTADGKASLDRMLETRPNAESIPAPDSGSVDFNDLKADPGRPGLESLFREIAKLRRINEVGLTAKIFAGVAPKTLEILRRRAATEPPSELKLRVEVVRYTLVAAFCWIRRRQVIDGLVELLIQIIHRIGVSAEKKVERELLADFRRVRGKMTIFAKMVNISIDQPQNVIEKAIYPEVGLETLRSLSQEFKSSGPAYREVVRSFMLSSYSNHYRRLLPVILDALVFRSNNDSYRPILNALELLKTHRHARGRHFPPGTDVPVEGVVASKWRDSVFEVDKVGKERVNRITYEIAVLQALRDGLRSKEIWVEGADRFRNPDEDLPMDFSERRDAYYAALNLPKDPEQFTAQLRAEMTAGLKKLDRGMPSNELVRILQRGPSGRHISITPLEAQDEPENLELLKAEIAQRWPATNLLDVLKEAELRVGFTDEFRSAAGVEKLDRETLRRRLLLCLYGMGTNTGLRRVLSAEDIETYKELLYIRRRFINKTALRNAIARVANATFAIRRAEIWGEGTTSCASDSKKFGAWDQNLMTEWHIRYGGRGVMIYWHVDKKSVCIYSQLKRCSSSEVAAMIEGVLRHCTDMDVQKNYVDSHGQSEIAFAFSRLLGFELMPRLKNIKSQVLYVPEPGDTKKYSHIARILKRPINWDIVHQQYDEAVKYATALRLGTADSEAILRRFTRRGIQHPTYAALAELGKAVKTSFLCRYLDSELVRREIHEGLNVVENWNGTNGFIFYGKGGEVATNRLEDQELSVLSLHLLQLSLVYVNTLMIQRVLAEQAWFRKMGERELRALSPLIYNHVNPYGRFELDMDARLIIDA